jgi:ubiquinone/menaquinone biosynthesis C-methylase UbiE
LSRIEPSAWDESARQYDSFEKRWHFYGAVADAMLAQLPIKEDSRILELACGTGACTVKVARLASRGQVVALDLSASMLEVAKENIASSGARNVNFVQGDAGDASRLVTVRDFDFAVCNSAFWHFPDPERTLRGLAELLRPSGEFAFSLPSRVGGDGSARGATRARVREILLRHGVTADELERLRARRVRERPEMSALLKATGFHFREVPFEFTVKPESRTEWRQISAFSGNRERTWSLAGVDPAVQRAVRQELEEWRKSNFPRDPTLSRWKIFVATYQGRSGW